MIGWGHNQLPGDPPVLPSTNAPSPTKPTHKGFLADWQKVFYFGTVDIRDWLQNVSKWLLQGQEWPDGERSSSRGPTLSQVASGSLSPSLSIITTTNIVLIMSYTFLVTIENQTSYSCCLIYSTEPSWPEITPLALPGLKYGGDWQICLKKIIVFKGWCRAQKTKHLAPIAQPPRLFWPEEGGGEIRASQPSWNDRP